MYDQTSQALKINNGLTKPFRTHRGVRQGCILSPKLFNLFVNDLPKIFNKRCDPVTLGLNQSLNCLMYADDLILISETATGLQICLDKLRDYTEKWDLKLNLKKTKIMVFNKGGRKNTIPFFFGGNVVEQTTSYKYLGTIITDTGNFKLNRSNLKRKGLRASYIILKNIGWFSKPQTAIRLYEKLIEPILLYNCEISEAYMPKTWDFKKFKTNMWDMGKEINQVTIGFIRQLLGVNKKSTNLAVLAETGKYPICIKIFERIMKYWTRISTSTNILLRESFTANILESRNGKQNWLKIIYFLTKISDLKDKPNMNQLHNKKIIKSFKTIIQNKFEDWWLKQATPTGKNKLDFYYTFKRSYKYETYLDLLPRHLRIPTTRFRISNHCLPIEVLRYTKKRKKERTERTCDICNLREMGDEQHYLLRCRNNEVSYARKQFIQLAKSTNSQMVQFTDKNIFDYSLTMKDSLIQAPLAKFIKTILDTFREETQIKKAVEVPITTRSGRLVKKPQKLDL